eukprot:3079688-Rhodomonas_salina.1
MIPERRSSFRVLTNCGEINSSSEWYKFKMISASRILKFVGSLHNKSPAAPIKSWGLPPWHCPGQCQWPGHQCHGAGGGPRAET